MKVLMDLICIVTAKIIQSCTSILMGRHMPLLVIALIAGVIAAGANVFSQIDLKTKHLMKLFGLM